MASVTKIETLPYDAKKIWDIVTSLHDYSWRSDVSKIDIILDSKQFVEYTHDGFSTTFTMTVFKPYQRYEFDMENENMIGHWTGEFIDEGNQTTLCFTEDVTAKKALMKPFVKSYLKKQQNTYFHDLKKALER